MKPEMDDLRQRVFSAAAGEALAQIIADVEAKHGRLAAERVRTIARSIADLETDLARVLSELERNPAA